MAANGVNDGCSSLSFFVITCAFIFIFFSSADMSHAQVDEYRPEELRPISDEKLRSTRLISKQYIDARIYIKNADDAVVLLKNIELSCFHDQDIYDRRCLEGDLNMCLQETTSELECSIAHLGIETDMRNLGQ